MRKFRYIGLTLIAICILASYFNTYARSNQNEKNKNVALKNNSLLKTSDSPTLSILDINNLTSFIQSDGTHPPVVALSWAGQFPKGSGLGGIFQEGVLWAGKVTDGGSQIVRVGGNTYASGNNATSPLFRVRPDYKTADLTDDAANFYQVSPSAVTSGQVSTIFQQYDNDWKNWPANLGAPFEYGKDAGGNQRKSGPYDPNLDIPGIPGASQTIFTQYDDRFAVDLYSSQPIGIEVQEILWAYAVSNPLQNVNFKKVRLVYKGSAATPSTARIDSMFIGQFSDPDVGNAADDYAGSDTTLNMGYAYNSSPIDSKYSTAGLTPPAMGYDFLQGASYKTGDQTDSAIVNLKWKHGYKYFSTHPMSGMIYFAAGGAWSDPALATNNGNYDNGALQMYNLLRGYLPSPNYPAPKPFPRPVDFGGPEGGVGTYLLDGDPVAGTGWNDGVVEPPGDRRLLVINGPISMSLHDTAEVVIALVGGMGSNNLTSISVMKYNDIFAQYAYDNLFILPSFPVPLVQAAELDGQIVLNWGYDVTRVNDIEVADHKGYNFEGYNVYQLPTASSGLAQATKIATYDVVNNVTTILDNSFDVNSGLIIQTPVQIGKNTGISRFITLTQDAITKKALLNGQAYYFAVTAYGYNPSPTVPFHALESSLNVITVTPHSPNPGTRYVAGGTVINAKHTAGISDGVVKAVVIDPTKVTGANYQVTFNSNGSWTLTRGSQVVLDNQTNQSGNADYKPADGLEVIVTGPTTVGLKSEADGGLVIPAGSSRRITQLNGDGLGLEGWRGVMGYLSPANYFNGIPMIVQPSEVKNLLIKLATVDAASALLDFNPTFNATDPNLSYGYRYLRGASGAPARPEFAPYIVGGASYDFQDYKQSVPMAVYNNDDPANPKRLAVGFLENNSAKGQVDGKYWPEFYNDLAAAGVDNTGSAGPREWLFIMDDPYTDATPNPLYQANILTNADARVMYMMTWPRRDQNAWAGTDQMEIFANKLNTTADVFSFTAPSVTTDPNLAKQDVNKINVFPNPYYGYNYRETSREGKYVTFNHLPANAKIRIFDLAGVLVRTIDKLGAVNASQFATWDLRNSSNYPVASGIYVAYIDMPDLGKTKILKVAIIQEEQVLPIY